MQPRQGGGAGCLYGSNFPLQKSPPDKSAGNLGGQSIGSHLAKWAVSTPDSTINRSVLIPGNVVHYEQWRDPL